MKLPGEEDQRSMGSSVIYMVIGVSAFVLILLLSVMKNNKKTENRNDYAQNPVQQEETVQPEEAEPERKLRAEDLSFWDMYPVDGNENEKADKKQDSQKEEQKEERKDASDSNKEQDSPKEESEQKEVVQEDPSTDGKHTLIKNSDGTEEWVLISPYLTKNTYDLPTCRKLPIYASIRTTERRFPMWVLIFPSIMERLISGA